MFVQPAIIGKSAANRMEFVCRDACEDLFGFPVGLFLCADNTNGDPQSKCEQHCHAGIASGAGGFRYFEGV